MIYRIKHFYDIGDQSAYVESDVDPLNFCVYIHFIAENIQEDITLDNSIIADALVAFYNCKPTKCIHADKIIDMHLEREAVINTKSHPIYTNSTMFYREGLQEYIYKNVPELFQENKVAWDFQYDSIRNLIRLMYFVTEDKNIKEAIFKILNNVNETPEKSKLHLKNRSPYGEWIKDFNNKEELLSFFKRNWIK